MAKGLSFPIPFALVTWHCYGLELWQKARPAPAQHAHSLHHRLLGCPIQIKNICPIWYDYVWQVKKQDNLNIVSQFYIPLVKSEYCLVNSKNHLAKFNSEYHLVETKYRLAPLFHGTVYLMVDVLVYIEFFYFETKFPVQREKSKRISELIINNKKNV